jgi:GT2 family glycosyltransferase
MIPTFHCASHLSEALRGVLSQAPSADQMQIEVVDDASTLDDPESVVRQVAGDRVQFVRQPANVGHVRNFATCLQRARGHYVHLLHGDDFVLPGFYAALQRGFESDPAIGAAFCRWMVVDQRSQRLSVVDPLQSHPGLLTDATARLAEEQRIVTPSIAVRRTAYEQLGGFDERLHCAEDWEMWVRIAATHLIWYEPTLLAAYRTHPDSNTGRHFRLAGELDYTMKAISMFRSYLPAERAPSIVRTARRAYARTALSNAREFAQRGDSEAARAHLRAALRFSRSPRILLQAARLLPGSARS